MIRFHNRFAYYTTLAATCWLCCMSRANAELLDGIAARVNDKTVLVSDVSRMVGPLYKKLRQAYSGDELNARLRQARDEALAMLIEKQLILSSYGDPNPEALEKLVDNRLAEVVRSQFAGDRTAFLAELAEAKTTLEEWRESVRDRFIILTVRRQQIAGKISVSPGAIQAKYEDQAAQYTEPAQVKLSMIVLYKGTTKKDGDLKRQQASTIRKQITEGTDFAILAKNFSEDVKAAKGGDWGWIDASTLKKELASVASGLAEGAVSKVVETDKAFYILKSDGHRETKITPLDDVRDEIRQELEKAEYALVYSAWIARLKERAYIKVPSVK